MRKIAFIITIFLLAFGTWGCGSKESKQEVIMTERQKEILREEGLSENYEELNYRQQEAIVAIEEMLCYLEDKYDGTFCYDGYVRDGILDDEHLTAYAEGMDPTEDSFDVYRTADGFTDNYMAAAIRDSYENYLAECILQADGVQSACVFASDIETELSSVPTSGSEYDGNVSAANTVFVYVGMSSGDCSAYVRTIQNCLSTHSLSGSYDLVFMETKELEQITEDNYTDFLWPADNYFHRETIMVN